MKATRTPEQFEMKKVVTAPGKVVLELTEQE